MGANHRHRPDPRPVVATNRQDSAGGAGYQGAAAPVGENARVPEGASSALGSADVFWRLPRAQRTRVRSCSRWMFAFWRLLRECSLWKPVGCLGLPISCWLLRLYGRHRHRLLRFKPRNASASDIPRPGKLPADLLN